MILPTPDHFSTAATPAPVTGGSTTNGRRQTPARRTPAEQTELASVVIRAQAGDQAAQAELVRRYSHRIAGYARLIIRQPDAVEDVVQMIFIKMCRRLGRLRDATSFESWLFQLARNTSVDFIRRRRCRPLTVPFENDSYDIPDPSGVQATSEIMDAFDAALTQLSPLDRQLMTLFVQGNSYKSLARKNGLTMGAVKARFHRMRPFLRSFVGQVTETRHASAGPWATTNRVHLAA